MNCKWIPVPIGASRKFQGLLTSRERGDNVLGLELGKCESGDDPYMNLCPAGAADGLQLDSTLVKGDKVDSRKEGSLSPTGEDSPWRRLADALAKASYKL